MKRIKLTKNFYLDELVAPEIYNRFGEGSTYFLDAAMVEGVQLVRNTLNRSILVNNWATGGAFKYSGLRPWDCPFGAEYSRHKFGACVDIRPSGTDLVSFWDYLRGSAEKFGITELEDYQLTVPRGYIHLGFGSGPFRIIGV